MVALIGLSDGRRSRERRAPVLVYKNTAGKGLRMGPGPTGTSRYVISRRSGCTPKCVHPHQGDGRRSSDSLLPQSALRSYAVERAPLPVLGAQAWGRRVIRDANARERDAPMGAGA